MVGTTRRRRLNQFILRKYLWIGAFKTIRNVSHTICNARQKKKKTHRETFKKMAMKEEGYVMRARLKWLTRHIYRTINSNTAQAKL